MGYVRSLLHRAKHRNGVSNKVLCYNASQRRFAQRIRQAVVKGNGERYLEHINVWAELVWRVHY